MWAPDPPARKLSALGAHRPPPSVWSSFTQPPQVSPCHRRRNTNRTLTGRCAQGLDAHRLFRLMPTLPPTAIWANRSGRTRRRAMLLGMCVQGLGRHGDSSGASGQRFQLVVPQALSKGRCFRPLPERPCWSQCELAFPRRFWGIGCKRPRNAMLACPCGATVCPGLVVQGVARVGQTSAGHSPEQGWASGLGARAHSCLALGAQPLVVLGLPHAP